MSIDVVQRTTYQDKLELLLSWYQDKERFKKILSAYEDELLEVEKALFEIMDEYTLDTATGVQLDVIGAIHGEARKSRPDEEYRQAIKNRIILNYGSGTLSDVKFAVRQLFGATEVTITELGNANVNISVDISENGAIYSEMFKVLPSGVGLIYTFGSLAPFFVGSWVDASNNVVATDDTGKGLGALVNNPIDPDYLIASDNTLPEAGYMQYAITELL